MGGVCARANLRVALAGAGTIGAGVIALLSDHRSSIMARSDYGISIVAIADPDVSKKPASLSKPSPTWYTDARDMCRAIDADVVVELIGGADGPARESVDIALRRGLHVVTANKAMMAHHGDALQQLADDNKVALCFEAAVAGGIPVIKTLREGLVASRITSIRGILNGTCNYILSTMALNAMSPNTDGDGGGFSDILAKAQEKGYAEADPSFDIDGVDAAHKLAILSSLAWGDTVDFKSVQVEGIRHISLDDMRCGQKLGYGLKHLAIARMEKTLVQSVHPCFIRNDDPLAGVDGVFNAVTIAGDAIGRLTLEGPGAGALPTAGAVVADLVDIARGYSGNPPLSVAKAPVTTNDATVNNRTVNDRQGAYYVRINALDHSGVMADISAALGRYDISVKTISQTPDHDAGRGTPAGDGLVVPIVITTHKAQESHIRAALAKITHIKSVREPPVMIRILSD